MNVPASSRGRNRWPLLGGNSYDFRHEQHELRPASRYESMDAADLEQHQLERLNQMLAHICRTMHFMPKRWPTCDCRWARWTIWPSFPSRSRKTWSAGVTRRRRHRRTGAASDLSRFPSMSAFIRPRARAAGRWWCSTRPKIGSGGSIAGSMCWTRPNCPSDDCVFMAFSFGPFIGFWSAFEAAASPGR